MGLLDSAGKGAAQEIHKAIDEVVPQAQASLDELVDRLERGIVTQLTGALTQAVGSLEIVLSSLPDKIVEAVDGLTVEVSPIRVRITRTSAASKAE